MSLTTHPHILREAFMYFAKFPNYDRVIDDLNARRSTDTSFPNDYAELKTELQALTSNNLVPDLKKYIFASSEDLLKKQIEDINDSAFMFLDYGQFNTKQEGTTRVKSDYSEFGITIARKLKPESFNSFELIIHSDKLLNYMRTIRAKMIEDQQCSPFLKRITFPHNIMPFYARDWGHATGWSMMFQQKTTDML